MASPSFRVSTHTFAHEITISLDLPPRKERSLLNGQVALVVNPGHDTIRVANLQHADQFHGSVFTGAFSRFDTTTIATILSICFKPGGARLFLPIPVAELANQVVALSCIFGTAAFNLREQLQVAQTNDKRVRILERFFLSRISYEHTLSPALRFALTSFQAGKELRSISEMTTHPGLNPQRFISLCEEAAGLTRDPCSAAGCAFKRCSSGSQENNPSGGQTALGCGYARSSPLHSRLSGVGWIDPQRLPDTAGEHSNHVPLP